MINLHIFVYLIFGVIFIWESLTTMIKKAKIFHFMPFYLIGKVASLGGAFILYNANSFLNFSFLKFLEIISLIWILSLLYIIKNG